MTFTVAWDVSHGEFTIEDGYYFSILARLLPKEGIAVRVTSRLEEGLRADALVLNYPEKPFTPEDIARLRAYVAQGGRLLALAYYNNEDRVAELLNALAEGFGVRFLYEGVQDPAHCLNEDPYMLLTRRVPGYPALREVFLPYAAPIAVLDAEKVRVLAEAEPSASSPSGVRVLATETAYGRGTFVAVGTCVFWDNYAIDKADNRAFTVHLLRGG